jgi:molybdopterin-guanine dinucleotide biosynthesis protein A
MPYLNADFIQSLCEGFVDEPALVPRSNEGFEPLHAVYAPACMPIFERELQGERKMKSMKQLLEEVGARWSFVDERLEMFSNWNTPDDVM